MKIIKTKVISILLTIIIASSLFASCSKNDEIPIDSYFSYLRKTQYERIYTMFTDESKALISLDDMVIRYTNIYSALAINSMTYDLVSKEFVNDACHVFFILHIDSQKLGLFDLNMSAIFINNNGKWELKWEPALLLPGMSDGDEVRITSTPAERGEIFASDGTLLAQNAIATSVYVNIDKIQNDESLIRIVSPIISMDENEIRDKLALYYKKLEESTQDTNDDTAEEYTSVSNIVVLKAFSKDKGLTDSQMESLLAIDGIGIDTEYMSKYRYYPNGSVLSHIIGYVGVMTADEAMQSQNKGLPADTMIGKSGLEKEYEMYLRAQAEYKLTLVDKYGHEKQIIAFKEGIDGLDLRLNIDIDLQIKSELLLMQNLTKEMSGVAIVMNPSNGNVLSIASFPSFDPNLFAFSMSQDEWDYLNDPINRNPLYNRAISGLYPPGSTFKAMTAAMAIDTDSINRNYVFTGDIDHDVWIPDDPEWVYPGIKRFARTPGDLNMQNAIAYSDNIYFADVAMKIGSETFYDYCVKYGMNEAISFDLNVPSAKISNSEKIGDIKLLADSGYGQGELLVSPLQMASIFSSLANEGNIMVPRLIDSINKVSDNKYYIQEEFDASIWKKEIISKYAIDILTPYLRKVITHGTGKLSYISGLITYGKTGTAEIGTDKSREIAWFIGYTLGSDPRLVCVMLEVPTGEGDVKHEIAKNLFQ